MEVMSVKELLQFIEKNEDKVIIVEVEYGTCKNQTDSRE